MTRNHIFSLTTGHFWPNEKDLNQKSHRSSENERNFRDFTTFFVFSKKQQFSPKKPKNHQFRSFSELRWDFWFKSFLLDQKYTVFYENIWFLVIAAHCCSLLLIFTIFFSLHSTISRAQAEKRKSLFFYRHGTKFGTVWFSDVHA